MSGIIAQPGVKRLMIFSRNTTISGSTFSAPIDLIDVNLRKGTKLTITDSGIEDSRKRTLTNKTGFKIEADCYNVGNLNSDHLHVLKLLHNHAKIQGCYAELVCETPARLSGPDGVYRFTGNDFLGIDFEYDVNKDGRIAKLNLEAVFSKAKGDLINAAAITNTAITSTGYPAVNSWSANQLRSFSLDLLSVAGNESVVLQDELADLSLKLKTVGQKSIMGRAIANFIEVTAEVTSYNASSYKVDAIKSLVENCGEVKFKFDDDDGGSELHTFTSGTLTLKRVVEIGEDKRELKLMFSGQVPLSLPTYSHSADSNGAYHHEFTY